MSNATKVTIGAELRLADVEVSIVSLGIDEGLSRITHATAEIATRHELNATALRGEGATITLRVNGVVARTFSFLVGRVAFDTIEQGSLRYRIDLYSPLWLLTHTKNTRKFRNLSAKDIVAQVLSEGGVAFDWKIRREPPKRKYCVQYRESNFAFVSRLLEFEGIYYVTRADGSLSLEDGSPSVDWIDGDRDFQLLEHAGALEGGELGIHAFGWGNRVGTGKVTLNDYSWKTPQVSLLQTKAADRDDELELYHYPAGHRKPDQGAELAQMRLEALRARTRFARGGSNVVHAAPGRKLTFEGEEVLLVEAAHQIHDPAFREHEGDEAPSYTNRFEAIPIAVPFRPPLATPAPSIDGCHTVMVRGPEGEEIHTDRFGRFKAQFHWDREATGSDVDSRWLRKLQEGATSINLARVGWEVSVAYVDGDPERPIGLARDINGAMVPAYGQPSNKQVMTIKTPTYPGKVGFNEVKLDDRAGAQRFDIRAELDLINRVNHDKTETIGNDETHVVDRQFKHKVQRDQAMKVGGDQSVTVGRDLNMRVDQSRTETIGGNQTLDIGKSLQVDVGANQTETVGSMRLSIVGSIKPPDVVANAKGMVPDAAGTAKSVGRAALKGARGGGGVAGAAAGAKASLKSMVPTPEGAASQLTGGLSSGDLTALASGAIGRCASDRLGRTVGAVHLAAAGDNVNVAAQYVHAEVVGGAKLTVSGDGITQSAGKVMALTVGGAFFKKAGQDAGYGAKLSKVTVGGLAKIEGKEKVELTSKSITLEATTSLRLESQGLAIELSPAKTSIEGNFRLEASEKVTVTGRDDNLTK